MVDLPIHLKNYGNGHNHSERLMMPQHYKGDRIAELLEELRHCELVFNHADPEKLNDELRNKLIAAQAHVAITKAKLTSLQD